MLASSQALAEWLLETSYRLEVLRSPETAFSNGVLCYVAGQAKVNTGQAGHVRHLDFATEKRQSRGLHASSLRRDEPAFMQYRLLNRWPPIQC